MKILSLVLLLMISVVSNAVPITYQFSGHITHLNDSWDDGYHRDPGFHDWWPAIGDSYNGTMIYDEDTLLYESDGAICLIGDTCGGLVYFEMQLGEELITFPSSLPAFAIEFFGESDFVAWYQSIGSFDSFRFSSGSFSGVDAAFWDGIGGQADSFVRVTEPSPLALVLFFLIILVYRHCSRSNLM